MSTDSPKDPNDGHKPSRRHFLASAAALLAGCSTHGTRTEQTDVGDLVRARTPDQRVDFSSATATCQVAFRRPGGPGEFGSPIPIRFDVASRACAGAGHFDVDRNRVVFTLESRLTLFHADDSRPEWLQALRTLGAPPPGVLMQPVTPLARRALASYGPGSFSVIQDQNRPVLGEVIAAEQGQQGRFFPARSYFDQYLVVKAAGRTYTNAAPLRVSATVNTWPPHGEVYRSERVVDFFDVNEPEGAPAFRFGACTIEIGGPLQGEELQTIVDVVDSLRSNVPASLREINGRPGFPLDSGPVP